MGPLSIAVSSCKYSIPDGIGDRSGFMSKRKVRIISAVPGAAHLRAILEEFVGSGPGLVTSVSDVRYRTLTRLLPEQTDSVRLFGDVVGEYITRAGGRKMILAQSGHVSAAVEGVCAQLEEDSPFVKVARFPGAHRRIAQTLGELRDWGLEADSLLTSIESLEGDLVKKIGSLALIERGIADSLRSIARERGADRIATCLSLGGSGTDMGRLLVVLGSDLSANQADWLIWAAEVGVALTVVVEQGANDGLPIVKELLDRLGGEREVVGKPNLLQANLFGASEIANREARNIEVQIVSASDPLAECEWTLRSVAAELRAGAEPGDLCIFCRDQEGYVPLLEASALRLRVPISCTRRLPLMTNSFARLTMDVLDFCSGNDVRAIAKAFRSTYVKLSAETRQAAETAVKAAYASGEKQWTVLEEWAKEHKEELPWLETLLIWRATNLRTPASLTEWCERFREFGRQPWHEEAVEGGADTGQRDGYAQTVLQRSLAQYASIERVQARAVFNLKDFVRTCRRIWEGAEVSSPSIAGSVQVVNSSAAVSDVRSLYVLGMLEGVFPRRRSEDPILTDAERAQLSALMPERIPIRNSHDKAAAERDEFCRLCGAASDKLVFSYPQTDDDRDNVPAFYLTEVERALDGNLIRLDHPRTDLTETPPIVEADRRLATALDAERTLPLSKELQTEEAKLSVSEAAKRHLTPADLSEVLECPFRFLVQRHLKLAPNRRRSRWHRLFRLPRDTGLASLPEREDAKRALGLALEAELARLISDGSPHDLALMDAGGKRLIDEWLEREFAARSLWPREQLIDKPSFERGDLRSKLKAGDSFVNLEGDFPALSERNGYRVLHLFASAELEEPGKSGEELWDRLKERLQFEIGLYLSALAVNGEKRVGVEVDTPSGGRLLFVSPRPSEESFRSDHGRGFKVVALDHDRRMSIAKNVADSTKRASARIQQAIVEPEPGKACRTCDFGELCRSSTEYGEEVEPFDAE
jgi:hypothetical protein